MGQAYTTPGKAATLARKSFRREVAIGRAAWTRDGYEHDDRGRLVAHPAMAAGEPVAPRRVALPATRTRRPFGVGILRSLPTYRRLVSESDEQWWAEESRRQEDREVDRMYQEFRAQERMDAGLDAY